MSSLRDLIQAWFAKLSEAVPDWPFDTLTKEEMALAVADITSRMSHTPEEARRLLLSRPFPEQVLWVRRACSDRLMSICCALDDEPGDTSQCQVLMSGAAVRLEADAAVRRGVACWLVGWPDDRKRWLDTALARWRG